MLLVSTVTFYWVRIDSAQARLRDDALSLRDYRLLSEIVNGWLLSNDLVFGSGETHMVAAGLHQGEQIQNLAMELLQEPLAQHFENAFIELIALIQSNQRNLLQTQQDEVDQFRDLLTIWDDNSQQVVNRVVNLGELLINASEENSRIAAEERRIFIALISIECLIFSLLIFMLWRWATRLIVQPLGQLTEAAHRALQDGTAMTVKTSHVSEIETLSRNINEFTGSLAQRVEDRTRQLEEQKQHLVKEIGLRKTAQKVAQAAAAKAITASEAKTQFMANMSHEIRTPINGIIGSAQLLGIMELDKKARNWIQTIEDSGNHLLSLVTTVLDYSEIDAGQFNLCSEVFFTGSLIEKCRSTFRPQAEKKELDLHFELDHELPEKLLGDRQRIQQILVSLVGNAIKFTEGGSITVSAKVVMFKGESITLRWQVIDTGVGIPEDRYQSIFESFEQIDNSDTRKYGGSGLGLTVSRELARMMEGDITVESKIGAGSTFSCTMNLGLVEADYSNYQKPGAVNVGLPANNA